MSRARFALIGLALALFLPGAAEACSVCFSTTEENRWAFIATTVFLSALPLGIVFGIGAWLRHKVLEMEQDHEAARSAASLTARPPRMQRRDIDASAGWVSRAPPRP